MIFFLRNHLHHEVQTFITSSHNLSWKCTHLPWFHCCKESILKDLFLQCEPVVPGAMGCGQKKLLVSVVVPPAPVRVPSQRQFAPHQSHWSLMIGDKEMILGAVHRSSGIALQLRKPLENLSQETIWWRGCVTSHRLKWDVVHQVATGPTYHIYVYILYTHIYIL